MAELVNIPAAAKEMKLAHGFCDHFHAFLTAQSGAAWTVVTDVDGTVLLQDATGGRVAILSATASAAGNEDTYLARNGESFLFADAKPLEFAASIQFTEANTDDANVIVGLMDAVAVDHLQDDGAGPAASYSGIVFFKVDGGTRWQCETSITTTQTTTDLTAANSLDGVAKTAGGADFQELKARFVPYSSTKAKVDFFIDGVHVATHDYTYTSATEVQFVIGVKDGSAANEETVVADWAYCYQKV